MVELVKVKNGFDATVLSRLHATSREVASFDTCGLNGRGACGNSVDNYVFAFFILHDTDNKLSSLCAGSKRNCVLLTKIVSRKRADNIAETEAAVNECNCMHLYSNVFQFANAICKPQ